MNEKLACNKCSDKKPLIDAFMNYLQDGSPVDGMDAIFELRSALMLAHGCRVCHFINLHRPKELQKEAHACRYPSERETVPKENADK